MKKSTLALAIMALVGSGAALAASPNVQGGTSNSSGVAVGSSNHGTFGGGNSGVALNGASTRIDLAGGPINGSNNAIAARGNGTILTPADMGMLPLPINVAQVWKDTESVNGAGSTYANFAVNSIRQITTLPIAPQFGGLVIGQVATNSSGAPASPVVPLAVGSGVYFGEWAPRATGTPPANSTNLNMTSADRTVWYVGDNAVTAMPTLVNAVYGVIGINQTGTDAAGNVLPGGLPGNQNFYTGKLTANYGSGTGSITGTIDRGSSSINFAGTSIGSNGTFNNGSTIEGRFYNNADALAGIYTGGASVADHVAFGGSKIAP
ncbi:Slam-dependent surface lipoprotein [Stutzerimonas nitrititolerans]|uniref:Slam-dependent surface lipoprotein n=1 Tax=Stutzerimonas nitrititolerans TaxID=2482751 RepID=UPI002898244B|nr:Slam-dependent surface lipoprotein [Stutzerimonas nitrititolerans]